MAHAAKLTDCKLPFNAPSPPSKEWLHIHGILVRKRHHSRNNAMLFPKPSQVLYQ